MDKRILERLDAEGTLAKAASKSLRARLVAWRGQHHRPAGDGQGLVLSEGNKSARAGVLTRSERTHSSEPCSRLDPEDPEGLGGLGLP